jgi:hypothetical protein
MVARYEEVPSDKRRLSSGQEVAIVWPDAGDETMPTVFVDYISSRPTQLENEAEAVWQEIRPEAERRDIRRVALRPTVVEKGFKWCGWRPSFWRASTSTYWYGRSKDGHWTVGDPGVSSQEAPPNIPEKPVKGVPIELTFGPTGPVAMPDGHLAVVLTAQIQDSNRKTIGYLKEALKEGLQAWETLFHEWGIDAAPPNNA